MSDITFHSPSGSVTVSGSERAHAGLLCFQLFYVALGINEHFAEPDLYRKMLPAECYVKRTQHAVEFFLQLRTWLFANSDTKLSLYAGKEITPFHAALNTAITMGSDPIRLLAKLDAQCELHTYVEGPNRAWLADIIEQGVKSKILRVWEHDDKDGWPAVMEFLRSRDDEPVVTSHSIGERFPNRYIALWNETWAPLLDHEIIKEKYELTDEDDVEEYEDSYASDLWYGLTKEEQWKYAMEGLRLQNIKSKLEMAPENFAHQSYGNGMNGFDIVAMLEEYKHVTMYN